MKGARPSGRGASKGIRWTGYGNMKADHRTLEKWRPPKKCKHKNMAGSQCQDCGETEPRTDLTGCDT